MKVKGFVLLVALGVVLTAFAVLPAHTYVPSSEELATVVGGGSCEKCDPDKRCIDDDNECSGNQASCEVIGVEDGDPCGKAFDYTAREGCVKETSPPWHYCDYGSGILVCYTETPCECEEDPGEPGSFTCTAQTPSSHAVNPCQQTEMK